MRSASVAAHPRPETEFQPLAPRGRFGLHAQVTRIPDGVSGPVDIFDGRPAESELVIAVPVVGTVVLTTGDAREVVADGDLVILDGRHPFAFASAGSCELALVRLPRVLVTELDDALGHATGRVLETDSGMAALVAPAAVALCRAPTAAPESLDRLARHLADLLSTLIAELGEPMPADRGGTLLADVRWYVNCCLGDPALSPETIAAAHFVSVRYLHKLFEGEGTTVGRWIHQRRLQECRRELGRFGQPPVKVATVAHRWGFVNSAHFSRAFRGAFGVSPRDWREARTSSSGRELPSPSLEGDSESGSPRVRGQENGVHAAVAANAASRPSVVRIHQHPSTRRQIMPSIKTHDGTEIFYKDWGSGRPVVFSHGWPLNADAWDPQANLVASHGYRAIAHDRRGHGRSSQPWDGNFMDQYADDLAELIEKLDLTDAVLVGHSTGGGEVVRYLARHGTSRVSKAVLLGAVPPLMLKTDANPDGLTIDVFDGIRAGVAADRSQFYKDLSEAFYGFNREGAAVSQGKRDEFWYGGMQVGIKGAVDCIKAFSETDFTDDLPKIDIPVLVAHGDDDQIVPIAASALRAVQLLPNATLRVYEGAPHGLTGAFEKAFNADLLAFLEA